MSKKFYIADWHYDHANCLAFDNRPFKTIEEMNVELVRRWNEAVREGDHVYILGDMFWKAGDPAVAVLQKLHGKKFLVQGNHDRVHHAAFHSMFENISPYMEVKDGKEHVVLCHYPMPCFKNHYYGWCHLYGHVHTSFEANMMEHQRFLMTSLYDTPCRMFNVGAMLPYMDYTPRTLEEILAANEPKEGS